ncbi:MAG: PadR family transcriptional regulator [Chloroflexota bacterium]|nr:PadR family transcriptional regulator [Chloroflexota bacterium]
MTRTLGAAEPARYVLLGLLLRGPRHGYDLARHFVSGSAIGEVIRLSASQLYALLLRLERDELIAGERQEVGSHPPRRVFRLTPEGRDAVLRWVTEPVDHPRDMLIEFPLKLYLAGQVGPGHAAALVQRQRALFARYLERLGDQTSTPETARDAAFVALVREGRIGRVRAALEWLNSCAYDHWFSSGETVSQM